MLDWHSCQTCYPLEKEHATVCFRSLIFSNFPVLLDVCIVTARHECNIELTTGTDTEITSKTKFQINVCQ